MVKKLAEATGSITFSQRGEKGEKGDNGVGVKGFNTYYDLSDNPSSPPTVYGYDTLSDTIIKTNKDKYVWSADKVLYTDGTGDDFINAYCIGKCSDLTSVKEQYGTSTSAGTKPSENAWEYTYPSNPANGTYVWSRDEIVWAGDNSTTHSDAQLIGYIAVNGKDGVGMVVAYQQAASKPTSKPKVTSYEKYKNTNDLENNWVKSAPSNGSVLTSGGSISGVRYNQNPSGGDWQSGVSDGGNSWYKSPEVGDNGIAKMQIHFTTSVDGQYVTFYIKAYSEKGYDFILVSEIDSTNVTRNSGYSTRASGNGVEESVKLKCEEAGSHFVTIAYAKDVSGKLDNYDYGLVRMATNENYVYVSTLLYRCDGDVNDGVISWGSIYQAQGEKGQKGDTGARGTKGALMREHDGFESGSYKYLSGAGEEAYVDVVCVEGNWYQCTTTYDNATSSPSLDDGHWTLMNNYKSIATHLLLAENATIKMLGSNQINLYNPSGGAMYGSYRVVENDSDWSLWLGASAGGSAPFGVTRGGAIKATAGTIGGVEISQDKLGVGVADIGNHTFKGAILSSGGIFAGYKTSYVGAGTYAAEDPSGSNIQMYDQKAIGLNPTQSVSSPSLYVRKYSSDNSIINNIDKYFGAALLVDVPIGVGVASLGNNVLGGLSLSAVAGDFDIGSTDYLFQKNRGTVAYFTNSSGRRFYLPANPHEGQVVIVIQGSSGKITFYHTNKRLVIQNTVKSSGEFYSNKQGQLNIFVYIGTMWYGTYSNG